MEQGLRRAGRAPKVDEQRGGAGAVDVIVAKNGDLLGLFNRVREPVRHGVHVAQRRRVRQEVAQLGIEIAGGVGDRDAAPGDHPRKEIVDAMRLGQRERLRLASGVQPPAPTSTEHGALDPKKGGNHRIGH